jgi:hypothetical protein
MTKFLICTVGLYFTTSINITSFGLDISYNLFSYKRVVLKSEVIYICVNRTLYFVETCILQFVYNCFQVIYSTIALP